VLGYASPADPIDPPAELTDQQPVTAAEEPQTGTGETGSESMSPRELVRELGEAQPPRDAVPVPDSATAHDQPTESTTRSPEGVTGQKTREPARTRTAEQQTTGEPARSQTTEPQTTGVQASERPSRESPSRDGQETAERPPEAWLDAVERRLTEAERLSAVESTEEAHEAVVAAGGIDEVRALQDRLAADHRRVEAFQARCGDLDTRLADIEIPLATLERVA
jgi:hypothetical protein